MYRVSVPNCESIACNHFIPYSPRVNVEQYRVHCTPPRINHWIPFHTILTTLSVNIELYRVHFTPPRINRWIPFHTIITTCRTGHVTGYTVPNCESITGHHSIPYSPRVSLHLFHVHCPPANQSLNTYTIHQPRNIPSKLYPHRESVTEKTISHINPDMYQVHYTQPQINREYIPILHINTDLYWVHCTPTVNQLLNIF